MEENKEDEKYPREWLRVLVLFIGVALMLSAVAISWATDIAVNPIIIFLMLSIGTGIVLLSSMIDFNREVKLIYTVPKIQKEKDE